jgi:tetrahydromethanopterin S-methyltransferase subunit G
MSHDKTVINAMVYTEDLQKVAQRIYDIMDPWEREFTTEEIAQDIAESPLGTIKYLLTLIEES